MRRFSLGVGIALAALVFGWSLVDATPPAEARTPPPAAAATKQVLYITISGPTDVVTRWTCSWTAYVYGGTPPYTYQWYPQGMVADYTLDDYWSGHATVGGWVGLNVFVTDANNQTGWGYLSIYSSNNSEFCIG